MSDTKLACNASGAGELTYSWQRLDTSSGGSTAVRTNSSVLTIRYVQLSDSGTYQCSVTDAAGQMATSNRATLQVSAHPSVKTSLNGAPSIIGAIAVGAALLVVVTCVVLAVLCWRSVYVNQYNLSHQVQSNRSELILHDHSWSFNLSMLWCSYAQEIKWNIRTKHQPLDFSWPCAISGPYISSISYNVLVSIYN